MTRASVSDAAKRETRLRPARIPLAAAGAALLLLTACGQKPPGPPPAVPVTAAEAERKDVPVTVTAIGTVEPFNAVAVKSQVAGQVSRVAFKEGQSVRRSDLLVVIDPRPFEASLRQAEATLARDRAMLKSAEAEAQRYADLVRKDYVTQQQFDDTAANAAALKATVQADEAAVDRARLDLAYCSVRSPIDGRTGNLLVQLGNVVKENDATLVTVNQITPIYVAFSVPESQLTEIRRHSVGGAMKVVASPTSGGGRYTGELTLIDNAVDPGTGTILLKGTFPNADEALWPGTFVNVSLDLTVARGAVVVPTQAIQHGQAGEFLFVITPDLTVEMRTVTAGQASDGLTVIEKGIEAGERVVTDGQLRLFPGAKVEIKAGSAAGPEAGRALEGNG
jgi:multidrug efflux system membrane fusion protein